jgi:hypothetical protein
LLKRYLAEDGLGLSIQWNALPEKMTDDIHRVIEAAPERKRSGVDRDFREIQDLADEGGAKALVAEGLDRHHNDGKGVDPAPTLAAVKRPLHFAFLAFLDHRDVFDVASDLHRADGISRTRWRGRSDVGAYAADVSKPAAARLEKRISEHYLLKEGRGQHCHVDHWKRDGRLYWFAYPEDHGQAPLGYDEDHQLLPRPHQPAFDLIFVFCQQDGSLDISVKGDKQTLHDLQRIFAEVILRVKLWAPDTEPVKYELDALMDRHCPLPLEPEDGVEEVRIRRLRLRVMRIHDRKITLEANSLTDPRAVYDMLDDLLENSRTAEDMLRLTGVGMQLVFRPNERGTKRTLAFDVGYPNACSLKYADPRHEVAPNLLQRWGIHVSARAQNSPAARRRSRQGVLDV